MIRSFDACCITSQYNLHSALAQVIRENKIINDYVDDLEENEDLDFFVDDMFDPITDKILKALNNVNERNFFGYDDTEQNSGDQNDQPPIENNQNDQSSAQNDHDDVINTIFTAYICITNTTQTRAQ